MFIKALQKQNPRLIASALTLWKQGKILPDSYVIDVRQVLENGQQLVLKAKKHDISLYLMAKQIGRNPYLCRQLLPLGFEGLVAVDYKEVRHYYSQQLPVSHIGHLVQIPNAMISDVLNFQPEVITVYSFEKLKQIAKFAEKLNKTQSILIKIHSERDIFYAGQQSGIALSELADFVERAKQFKCIQIIGVTHFPCLLLDERGELNATENFYSLIQAKAILQQCGIDVLQINAPSSSCINAMPLLSRLGATHAEPGHALTGTIPLNQAGNQPEKVAMLYLSEISHQFDHNSYCFGGGYYRRGHLENALIGEQLQMGRVLPFNSDNIDYTLEIEGQFEVGEPVIMCFRTQIFVTRSDVVLIDYDEWENPYVIGVYDSLGNEVKR